MKMYSQPQNRADKTEIERCIFSALKRSFALPRVSESFKGPASSRWRDCVLELFAAEELAEAIAAVAVPARQSFDETGRSLFKRNPCRAFFIPGALIPAESRKTWRRRLIQLWKRFLAEDFHDEALFDLKMVCELLSARLKSMSPSCLAGTTSLIFSILRITSLQQVDALPTFDHC